jgi:hypothetical protein
MTMVFTFPILIFDFQVSLGKLEKAEQHANECRAM